MHTFLKLREYVRSMLSILFLARKLLIDKIYYSNLPKFGNTFKFFNSLLLLLPTSSEPRKCSSRFSEILINPLRV